MLRDDQTEVEITENIDYGDTDYRFEMEGNSRGYDRDEENLGSMGYQKQEFDEDGELVSADEEDLAEEFDGDFEGDFEDSLDE